MCVIVGRGNNEASEEIWIWVSRGDGFRDLGVSTKCTHTLSYPHILVRELDRNAGEHAGATPGGSVCQKNMRKKSATDPYCTHAL